MRFNLQEQCSSNSTVLCLPLDVEEKLAKMRMTTMALAGEQ